MNSDQNITNAELIAAYTRGRLWFIPLSFHEAMQRPAVYRAMLLDAQQRRTNRQPQQNILLLGLTDVEIDQIQREQYSAEPEQRNSISVRREAFMKARDRRELGT